jgi:hypothetical protein
MEYLTVEVSFWEFTLQVEFEEYDFGKGDTGTMIDGDTFEGRSIDGLYEDFRVFLSLVGMTCQTLERGEA